MCRADGAERERLLTLCREQDNPGWLQQHGTRLPKQLRTLIDHEKRRWRSATSSRWWCRVCCRPAFTYYLHEFALRLPVGGPAVLAEQLDHLLRMSRRSCLTLRVVPTSLGGHAGIAGPFTLMEFTRFTPVAYLDSQNACLFLEQPEEITATGASWRHWRDRTERGTIQAADCSPGNRARRIGLLCRQAVGWARLC